MKRISFVLPVLVLLAAVCAGGLWAESKTPRLFIKMEGYGSLSSAGDFGRFIDQKETYYSTFEGDPRYTISLSKQPFFRGFGGEIGIEVKKHAIGFSAGYISKKFSIDYRFEADTSDYESAFLWDFEFSAVPIFVFFHYKLIDSRFFNAFFTLGEGVYLVTYKDTRAMTFENADLKFIDSEIKARQARLGFHAGISLDFNITRNLAIFIDAGYRIAKFKEIEANSYYKDDQQEAVGEGILFYSVSEKTGDAEFRIDAADPPRTNWMDISSILDLNGVSLAAGLKIIF
jgi:hypothetical protein